MKKFVAAFLLVFMAGTIAACQNMADAPDHRPTYLTSPDSGFNK